MIHPLIRYECRDSDGFWVYLQPGHVLAGEFTHAICEDTKRKAYAKLKQVVDCHCQSCRREVRS